MPVQRRSTRQRRLVLDAVRSLDSHPTAGEVYSYVHGLDEKVSLATVYRNLGLLADEGAILAVKTPGECHYDHRLDPHDHVVCVECGRVVDAENVQDPGVDRRVEESTGYKVNSHYTVFEGVCPDCQRRAAV